MAALKSIHRHESPVSGATFSKDESKILTWSYDGSAKLWQITWDIDFPYNKYVVLIEVLTGTRFNPVTQQITTLTVDEWQKVRAEYEAVAKEHAKPKACQYRKQNLYLQKQARQQQSKAFTAKQ